MTPQSVREYAAPPRPHCLTASGAEKARLLTESCRPAGRHRTSAIRLLPRPPQPTSPRPGRRPRCGPEVVALLHQVWEASDYLCGKRLAPRLPTLVDALERHGALPVPTALRPTLLRLSPATIDRLLRPHRRRPRGLAPTGPGHPALAARVPLHTFSDWQDVQPGALAGRRSGLRRARGLDPRPAPHRLRPLHLPRGAGPDGRAPPGPAPVLALLPAPAHAHRQSPPRRRVTKRCDRAQAPSRRLPASGVLSEAKQQALAATYRALDPVALRAQIHDTLHRVRQLADRPRGDRNGRGLWLGNTLMRHLPPLR